MILTVTLVETDMELSQVLGVCQAYVAKILKVDRGSVEADDLGWRFTHLLHLLLLVRHESPFFTGATSSRKLDLAQHLELQLQFGTDHVVRLRSPELYTKTCNDDT